MALVEIAGLQKDYGKVRALRGIDIEIAEGEVLGLLGPNGSGKTTTVSILATLQRPTAGRALVAGRDVVEDAAEVRELISLTGQYASLDNSLSARENLAMFGRLTGLSSAQVRERVAHVAEVFELTEFIDRRVSALSGGQRRRVDIACALVTRPRVLFLDEPTTGLDPRSRAAVWETIAALRTEGITVLLTTQYLEEADRLADTIVMLDHGRVVARGTPEQLKHQAGSAICEITLLDVEDVPRVEAALADHEFHDTALSAQSRPVLAVEAPGELDTVVAVASALRDEGVGVFDIALRRPSLDEVFLSLTGESHCADESRAVGERLSAGEEVSR
ncbi:putative ABC transporter ATP-binding protein [Gordonia aichiensis NBRC 108223]|uniref:Putative ABC transporter ATP-binding protein n=2 Tax=Gordonia aichiensis TaxID=36820 RepID=L7KJ91_9ACTN|nr:putative ABC transporter ATP-binding protein [Gordonia aichiensis NBRC 108223]